MMITTSHQSHDHTLKATISYFSRYLNNQLLINWRQNFCSKPKIDQITFNSHLHSISKQMTLQTHRNLLGIMDTTRKAAETNASSIDFNRLCICFMSLETKLTKEQKRGSLHGSERPSPHHTLPARDI